MSRAEQQSPPPPSIAGLAWPGSKEEPSRAEQSPPPSDDEPSGDDQSILQRHGLLHGHLDVTGDGTPKPPVRRPNEARRFA